MSDLKLHIDERGVAKVVLNRPDVHNAFNADVIAELTTAFTDLGDNPAVRVIVLLGEGRSFSAGADLSWMKEAATYSREENEADANRLSDMLNTINRCPKPVIGLIHGAAFGGGVGLTAVCDMAVAGPDALFSLSEVRLGLAPSTISPFVLSKIGAHGRRFFLTAERFGAAKAKEIGLVNEATDSLHHAEKQVEAWISDLLKAPPGALSAAKDLALTYADGPINDAMRAETARHIAKRRASDEAKEGLSAFFDKRKPDWSQS